MPRILFTSVFKPFGIDNLYGRRDSFPEIFHNRLTRTQGIFSYRASFNVLGIHVIANNISAPSTVLDYPSFKRFKKEVEKGYDYVGIGSVVPNFQKVKVMWRRRCGRSRPGPGSWWADTAHILITSGRWCLLTIFARATE